MNSVIKILIVENVSVFASLLQEVLEKEEDFQIVGYSCGEKDTLEMAREKSPDIILIDLYPGKSGLDGIRLSRKLRIETDARILILLEGCEPELTIKAFREGFASGCLFRNQLSFLTFYIRFLSQDYTAQEYMIGLSALDCLSEAEKSVFWSIMGKNVELKSAPKTILNQKRKVVKKFGLKNQDELRHIFRIFQPGDGPEER